MNRLDSFVKGMLKPINPYGASLLGLLTFFWGLWIVNPFWEVFNSAQVFSRAANFAPEWAWGTWATLCGITLITSVWRGNSRWLSRAARFASWHWATVSLMLWWGDWQNTAGVTYTFVALYSVYVFLNVRVNYVNQGISHF